VARRSKLARVAYRGLLGVTAAFAVCGAVELSLILVDFRWAPPESPIVVEVPGGWTDDGKIHRKDVRTLWHPSPGARIPWGDDERVNADGYRGPLLTVERQSATLRIATLGDSSTFGHSVAYEECYSARVGVLITERTGRAVEILDAGVVGHSVRQGLERWRTLVRAYRPDIVVAAYGAVIEHVAAMGLPDDELIREQVMNTSPVVMWTRRLRSDLRMAHMTACLADLARGGRLELQQRRWHDEVRSSEQLGAIGTVDWLGKRRVSLDEFERFLLEMRDEVRATGARDGCALRGDFHAPSHEGGEAEPGGTRVHAATRGSGRTGRVRARRRPRGVRPGAAAGRVAARPARRRLPSLAARARDPGGSTRGQAGARSALIRGRNARRTRWCFRNTPV